MWEVLKILGASFLSFGVAGLCAYAGVRSLDMMMFEKKEGDK